MAPANSSAGHTTSIDCNSTSTTYSDDVEAFELGFATFTELYPPQS
jgi:hypothetical protein